MSNKHLIKSSKHRFFTKALALMLSATMALSPITALAEGDEVGGNVGGGGTGSMGSSSDYKAWSNSHQGYRFYIINSNLERVTDVYDFVFSVPSGISDQYYTTRFDGASTPNGHDSNNTMTIDKLATLTGSAVSNIPKPVSNNQGHGEEFRDWFLQNAELHGFNSSSTGGLAQTGSKPSISGGSSSSSNGLVYTDAQLNLVSSNTPGAIAIESSIYSGISSVATIMSDFPYSGFAMLSDRDRAIIGLYRHSIESQYSLYFAESPFNTNAESRLYALASIYKNLKTNTYKIYTSPLLSYASATQDERISLSSVAIQYIIKQLATNASGDCSSSTIEFSPENSTLTELLKTSNLLYKIKDPTNESLLLDNQIPLAGEGTYETTSTPNCPALTILENKDAFQIPGYESAMRALMDNHYLIVEPITWLYIPSNGANYPSQGNKTYGSYYNIANKWTSQGGKDTGGFYSSYMTKLGNNCMLLTKDVTTETGKTIMQAANASRNISVSVAEMVTSGLSMHLYASNDFGGTPVYKVYQTESGSHIRTTTETMDETSPYSITDEPGFQLVKWQTSTEKPQPSPTSSTPWDTLISGKPVIQGGTTPTSLSITPTEKAVYILLQGQPLDISGDWTLHESQISTPVTTGTKTSTSIMSYSLGSLQNCETNHFVCTHDTDDDCGGYKLDCGNSKHTKSTDHTDDCYEPVCNHSHSEANGCYKKCSTYTLNDKGLSFTLKNTKETDFPSLLASSLGVKNNTISKDRTKTEAETVEASGFTYDFVIFRGNDKLNYAGYINNINTLGFTSASSKTAVTRKINSYSETLSINLSDNSSDLSTSAKGNLHGDDLFTDSGSSTTSISCSGTVAIQTYSGAPRAVNTYINDNPLLRLTSIQNDNTAGRQVDSLGSLKFNPYIRMTYAGIDAVKHDVYVLGEYQRTIEPDDYAEIEWKYNENNLLVQSKMWALDASLTTTTDERPWAGKNQVLKGGATYNLATKKQTVYLNTYQTILGSNSRAISSISGSCNLTEAEASSAHRAFVDEAINTYNKTEVIQYVSTNTSAETAWKDGIPVYSGADISSLNNGTNGTASTESKYYLRSDTDNISNVARADLDVKEVGTRNKYYRFYSDTSGNIYMVEGDSVSAVESGTGTRILDKTQDASALSGTAQFLDNRTLVVTKLIAALERNTGNDTTASWAPDGKWYNEAYSGVIIMVQRTEVEIKFDKTESRTTVLDPKLVPNINSKYEQGSTAYLSQYCTKLSESDVISHFKGQEIFMYKPNLLFNSNKFYITNMTVQNSK